MALILPTPTIIDPASAPAFRWGVIGTGIAGQFVHAIHTHTRQRAVLVTARDAAKTAAFAAEHGIPAVAESIEALVTSPDIDAVYVATPHPLHREQSLAAIAAGKHVLIEKPIAMSAAEAREILDAARAAGVYATEAMWTRYLPQSDVLRQVVADGLIGDVHQVAADFGFVAPADPTHRLWDPALGGGALLDAGVYPISFASSVIGVPTFVSAVGAITDGVDSRATVTMRGATGIDAVALTAIDTWLPVEAQVFGSAGRARLLSPFFGPSGIEVTTSGFGQGETAVWKDERFEVLHDGLGDQATAFAVAASEGRSESAIHTHDEIVGVMAVIDAARAAIASTA